MHTVDPVPPDTRELFPSAEGGPNSYWSAVLVLVAALGFSSCRVEPDLWGHVRYGLDFLRDGLPATTTYSYTAAGHPWINHENLFELSAAWVYGVAGIHGLLAAKIALGLIVSLLLLRSARRHADWPVALFSVGLTIAVLAMFWPARPQVLSYVYFAVLVTLLEFAFQGWRGRWLFPWGRKWARANGPRETQHRRARLRWLWCAAPLMTLWANTHGAFVAGLAVYATYLCFRGIEAWSVARARSGGMLKRLAMMLTVAILATGLNPYGPRLHLWLAEAMALDRPEITEWQAVHLGDETFPLYALLATVTLVGLVGSRESLDATELALLGITFLQATLHIRHLPFFAILVGFWLPKHWQSAWSRLGQGVQHATVSGRESSVSMNRWRRRILGQIVPVLLALGLAFGLGVRLRAIQVPRADYPVEALRFIRDRRLTGRFVVTYNWAQYAIWGLSRSSNDISMSFVEFDGRLDTCYPAEVIDAHFDLILGTEGPIARYRDPDSPPPEADRSLRRGNPDFALISRHQSHAVETLQRHADEWDLLYQDELAQLWGRRRVTNDPESPCYLPVSQRVITDAPQSGWVPWPAT